MRSPTGSSVTQRNGVAWWKIVIGATAIAASGAVVVLAVGLHANGDTSCAGGDVQYVETSPSSVPPAVTLSLADALKRASQDVGFEVVAPCKLPGPDLVIQAVSVTHLPQSLGSYAEISIIPADTPRENGHYMNPSPWIRIDQRQQLSDELGTTVIGTIGRNDVRYSEQKQRSSAPTDLPDSDSALYTVRGPHSWLMVSASGFPGSLPPQAEMLAMLESMVH